MNIISVWGVIKSYKSRKALPIKVFINRVYMKVLCHYVDLLEKCGMNRSKDYGLPTALLRYRVHGSPDMNSFMDVGKKCAQDIKIALKRTGKRLDSFERILDFGCGCGRTLIHFSSHPRSSQFYGTDIDIDAICWCRKNLDFASFDVNDPFPPLKYPSNTFDFIYAVSVFTHLDEAHQFLWLDELKRIVKPKGIVLLTIHGYHCWQNLPDLQKADIERNGFKFIAFNVTKGMFPNWYQTAYHTKEYIFQQYARHFNIVDYIPQGLNNHQHIVNIQKD